MLPALTQLLRLRSLEIEVQAAVAEPGIAV
jgi:hypothetical protein